jgi:hypothetical protein
MMYHESINIDLAEGKPIVLRLWYKPKNWAMLVLRNRLPWGLLHFNLFTLDWKFS